MSEMIDPSEQHFDDTGLPKAEATTSLALVNADTARFELQQREAKLLAASKITPAAFRGNVADVVVAMSIAKRLQMEPLMIMQNMHEINGKFGFSAQFLIAAFNKTGRFSTIKYELNEEQTACVAVTTELASGTEIRGPEITVAMAEAEGWSTKRGSKWKTMHTHMLRYRAAAFLIRTTAPEITFGFYTTDELKDINDAS